MGKKGLVKTPQGNRDGFLKVLRHLCRSLQKQRIWLYVDRAAWHKGEVIRTFLRAHEQIRLRYLPPYQPALNMQERVWRRVRYEITVNRHFDELDDIWDKVQTGTRRWRPNKVKQLCRIT